jgi:hypothetical protein
LPRNPDPDGKTERDFHEDVWALANNFSKIDRAMEEARDMAYHVKNQDIDPAILLLVAENWLDAFGRNRLKEKRDA